MAAAEVVDSPYVPSINGAPIDKVKKFGWVTVDRPGVYRKIAKTLLNIDHAYQREKVSRQRVLAIAAEWSWMALGTISVIRRDDGTFWVFDGQHRVLAAKNRADVDELPCMVFACDSYPDEAKGFLNANCHRGAVKWVDKFRAMVSAFDPVALSMKSMIEKSGYRVVPCIVAGSMQTVSCVKLLLDSISADAEQAQRAWDVCMKLHDGHPVHDTVYKGLFRLDAHLRARGVGLVNCPAVLSAIESSGITFADVVKDIRIVTMDRGHGGENSCAEGVIACINRKVRGRGKKLPSLYSKSTSQPTGGTSCDRDEHG